MHLYYLGRIWIQEKKCVWQGWINEFSGAGTRFQGPNVTPSKNRGVIGFDQSFLKRVQFNKMIRIF